jgi:hypothetical protein
MIYECWIHCTEIVTVINGLRLDATGRLQIPNHDTWYIIQMEERDPKVALFGKWSAGCR